MVELNSGRGKTDIRVLMALAAGRGDLLSAATFAAARGPAWRDAEKIIRAAAVGGQSAIGDSVLIGPSGTDLLSFIRPLELIGKLPLRVVPFLTNCVTTLSGTGAGWVGEGKPVAVSKPQFSRRLLTLPPLKVVAMSVETEELVRSAQPDGEVTISQDFIAACIAASDSAFIDPQNAGVANVKPASVSFGAPAFASSGTTAALIDGDLGRLIESLVSRGSNLLNAFWILHPLAASFLSRLLNVNGDRAYPLLNVRGGELLGLPALTSASVPHVGSPQSSSIILLDASRVWIARDPAMTYEASREATLEMLDNPTNDAVVPTPTAQVSMFQTSGVALRGTRFLNFMIGEVGSCAVLNGCMF